MFVASVVDETKVKEIATQVGAWDVLVLGAAHLSAPSTIVKAPLQDWWADYETNVKSVILPRRPSSRTQSPVPLSTALLLALWSCPLLIRHLSLDISHPRLCR